MTTASTRPPEGRYGRSSDERSDRRLKLAGAVFGALLLALMGYFAYYYVGQNKISAEVIEYDFTDRAVKVHLEVRKDSGASGYCTIRSQSTRPGSTGSSRCVRRRAGRRRSCSAVTRTDARAADATGFARNTYALTCVDVILVAYVLPLRPSNC